MNGPDEVVNGPDEATTQAQLVSILDLWVVRQLLSRLGRPAIDVKLWDGSLAFKSREQAPMTVIIRDRGTLWRLIWQPSIGFAEGYRQGRIEVVGNLVDLCRTVEQTNGSVHAASWSGLRGFGRRRSCRREAAHDNIHHHYDLGNDFYRLWLDEQLVYTCAYFPDPSCALEDAQTCKLDLVCRKLQLQPGDEVIEAGCGWGALALHMAANYGATVRAYNISRKQIEYARRRAQREGLADRVEFIEDDWRSISGECDKFVSVGMLEHVGTENYPHLGRVIRNVLRPEGLGLLHSIGRNVACPVDGWIQQEIFPGSEPPSLRQTADIFESGGFSVLDVENLRLHYARTLSHWLERFEQQAKAIRELFDEGFVRAWRLYLAASIAAFEFGGLQLFQIVFSHARNNAIPLTRPHPLSERRSR